MVTRLGERPVTTPQDVAVVAQLMESFGVDLPLVQYVTIPVAPYSKSRPKFTRHGRTYHDPKDKQAEQTTGVYLRATIKRPYTGNVALAALFFRPDRKRIDADNLLKHVCDAADGVVFVDDCQCTAIAGVIEYDKAYPRTVVAVAPHVSTLVRDLSGPPTNPKGGLPLW